MLFSSYRYPSINVTLGGSEESINPRTGSIRVTKRANNIVFRYGRFETNDLDIIEGLIRHPSYNRDFFGPFSKNEVKTGEYKKYLDKHIKKEISDNYKPDVEKIAKEGEKIVARPQVRSDSLVANQVTEAVRVMAADILKKKETVNG
jgi:hypothetical protein